MKLNFSADKHQSFLQVDTTIFDVCGQACLKFSKEVCNIFALSQERHE